MELIPALFLSGIAGGILAGLLGIGGGIIYVMILPYVFIRFGASSGQLVPLTIANSIFGIIFASLAASITHIKSREFYPSESFLVGIPGAVASVITLKIVVKSTWYTPTVFNAFLILFLTYMLISSIRKTSTANKGSGRSHSLKLGLTGLSGGSLSALTGLGGGSVVVPLLISWLRMDIKKAKSISLVMIFIISLSLTLFNLFDQSYEPIADLQTGLIVFKAALPLTAGVLIGSPFGVKIGQRLSSRRLTIIFGIFLLIVIVDKSIQLIGSL